MLIPAPLLIIPLMKHLFYFLLAIPICEILILLELGTYLSIFDILLLIIGTAAIGLFLVRRAGLNTLIKGQNKLSKGEIPQIEVIEGLLLLITGALLLTPGLITDSVGFLILIPAIRKALAQYALSRIIPNIISKNPAADSPTQHRSSTIILEGEFDPIEPASPAKPDTRPVREE
ncbi:MAG: FxsA family protein [Pseudomonadales bacterium]|nr:FxsA family protein [Pseudomonadales bacterium]